MQNKYVKRAHISEKKFREVLKFFAADFTVTQISHLTGISRVKLSNLIQKIRVRIYALNCQSNPLMSGEFEVDESYFGPKRVRGKRGRGASGKIKVFGLLKREGKVYTQVVPDVSARTLQGIIKRNIEPDSIVHTDYWRAYDGLVDLGYKKHYRVKHSADEFVNKKSHINGIESFWGYAKHRLQKFKGLKSEYFDLHLKETEFRFNNRKEDLYKILLKEFRLKPL
jgi:transposase-like protein